MGIHRAKKGPKGPRLPVVNEVLTVRRVWDAEWLLAKSRGSFTPESGRQPHGWDFAEESQSQTEGKSEGMRQMSGWCVCLPWGSGIQDACLTKSNASVGAISICSKVSPKANMPQALLVTSRRQAPGGYSQEAPASGSDKN